jgi:hypothetical protein
VRIGGDARLLQSQIVGVRAPAHGEQQMPADLFLRVSSTSKLIAMSLASLLTFSTRALRRTSMPSARRMSAMAAETSSSSRAISRGPRSITVTELPKRRIPVPVSRLASADPA